MKSVSRQLKLAPDSTQRSEQEGNLPDLTEKVKILKALLTLTRELKVAVMIILRKRRPWQTFRLLVRAQKGYIYVVQGKIDVDHYLMTAS